MVYRLRTASPVGYRCNLQDHHYRAISTTPLPPTIRNRKTILLNIDKLKGNIISKNDPQIKHPRRNLPSSFVVSSGGNGTVVTAVALSGAGCNRQPRTKTKYYPCCATLCTPDKYYITLDNICLYAYVYLLDRNHIYR